MSEAELMALRDRLVAWGQYQGEVRDLIKSGTARGLYPKIVEELAMQYIDQIMDCETDNLIDATREEMRHG